MAVNLSPIGGVAAQFLDNSGNPLSGGKIYTYAAGTTTPQATYTSASGTTPHSNPIILDAAGRVPSGEIWLTDGLQYKFLIKTSADVQIGSYDNIVGINSNFVNYTSSQEIQTATAGQTVFTLTTMAYQPGANSLSVFVDGVNQYGPGASYAYQETSSTVVTFTSGLHVGASVKFTTAAINSASATDAEQVGYIPPFTGGAATNVEIKLSQTVSVKDFGAVGNGIADDTTAIQAAISYLGSIIPWPVSTSRGLLRPSLYIPAGVYKVSSSISITFSGLFIYGDGSESSLIAWYGSNAPVFDIGTFSTSPSDIFTGPQDITFEKLRIQHASPGAVGFRSAQGIRSSGGGGLRLNQVSVLGFAYGINCPYGGDFNNYRETVAEYCDVGIYQGPGGQQFYTSKVNCFACVEGMVLDRVVSNMHDTFIGNNSKIASVIIEALGLTSTRQLTFFPPAGTSFQSQIVFNSPWMEGNAGGMGDDYTPDNFFEQRNNTVQAYRNITIKDPIIVAGQTGTKTTTSFFANTGSGQAAQLVHISNLVLSGYMTRFLTAPNGAVINNYRVEQGYTTPAFADNSAYQILIDDSLRSQTYRSAITGNEQYFVNSDSTLGLRVTYNNDNVVYAFSNAGTWVERFGFNVQNRRLFLNDPTSNGFSISFAASVPTTGTYAIGSFVYNQNPSVAAGKTLLGWQRLTTGSGHVLNTDWSPCYVTNT